MTCFGGLTLRLNEEINSSSSKSSKLFLLGGSGMWWCGRGLLWPIKVREALLIAGSFLLSTSVTTSVVLTIGVDWPSGLRIGEITFPFFPCFFFLSDFLDFETFGLVIIIFSSSEEEDDEEEDDDDEEEDEEDDEDDDEDDDEEDEEDEEDEVVDAASNGTGGMNGPAAGGTWP